MWQCRQGESCICERFPGTTSAAPLTRCAPRPPAPRLAGILTLSGYLRFWGWAYLAFTLCLALFKSEGSSSRSGGSSNERRPRRRALAQRLLHSSANGSLPLPGASSGSSSSLLGANGRGGANRKEEQDGGGGEGTGQEEALPLRESYLQLWWAGRGEGPAALGRGVGAVEETFCWSIPPHQYSAWQGTGARLSGPTAPLPAAARRRVVQLPAVRLLAVVLVTCRLAVLPAEAAAPLKLLEKGATKEALAGLVGAGLSGGAGLRVYPG